MYLVYDRDRLEPLRPKPPVRKFPLRYSQMLVVGVAVGTLIACASMAAEVSLARKDALPALMLD